MKQYWEKISEKLNAMSVRERVMVFAAIAVLLVTLANMLLLDPLFAKQKVIRNQLTEQQQQLSEIQMQIEALLQESSPNSTSPRRVQINQLKQEIAEGNVFLKSSRERLVQPDKMAEHLRKLLEKNSRLQLVSLQTLPVTPLVDSPDEAADEKNAKPKAASMPVAAQVNKVYKHGVELTLHGSYLDLMQYMVMLEKLPQQMYWARVKMRVEKYPVTELTLTLYTLSLDKTWLQV